MVKAQIFTVGKIFDGEIKESDLVLGEEELPPLQNDEYLVEALYLSVDPYMRAYARNYTVGQVMIGSQVAKIIESRNRLYPVGKTVVGILGWRTHTIIPEHHDYRIYILPDIGDLPVSLGLGVLGAPGVVSYFAFLEICQPIEGDTLVVTGAAGAVGSHVGQLGKMKGCRVVGITGSEQKARWLEFLGFDCVINYKTTPDLGAALKAAAPKGIDCYFDNVGGETSSTIMSLMNEGGRVAVCGSISTYNAKVPLRATIVQPVIVQKQLTLKGFVSRQYYPRWFHGIEQNLELIKRGQLKYRETITDGFESAPRALMGVMKGENTGKAIVRVKGSHVESETVDFNNVLDRFRKFSSNR